MFIFVLPPTFFNNRSNFGIRSAQCFPLSAFIHTEENDDLMFFHQIDDRLAFTLPEKTIITFMQIVINVADKLVAV